MKAINWIKNCYDCCYKEEFINDDDSPFNYLKGTIDIKFGLRAINNENNK